MIVFFRCRCGSLVDFDWENLAVGEELIGGGKFLVESGVADGEIKIETGIQEGGIRSSGVGFIAITREREPRTCA